MRRNDVHDRMMIWTPSDLRRVCDVQLRSSQLIVVSNRQPYAHTRALDGRIEIRMMLGGVVSALLPLMQICSGVWVAHGSGSADHDVVDANDRITDPNNASYVIRRVWLTKDEEEAYYNGFCNEGLWPLCHETRVHPTFRAADWNVYERVNARFAEAVSQEARTGSPVILVQDYHLALLPKLLRKHLPTATIVFFWHIPWPTPEAFAECPWGKELVEHMLEADIAGFHTRENCASFKRTVIAYKDHSLEKALTARKHGFGSRHACHVEAYPVSVEWPPSYRAYLPDGQQCRSKVYKYYGISAAVALGLGVDRWDFTKGILERLLALEALFDSKPCYRGCLTLLQVAAPTRSRLSAYEALQADTTSEVQRINNRFATDWWTPIILVAQAQPQQHLGLLYRAASFCLVNSVHDGMNLVAKEFVAARDDEDGVLILSTRAGASFELRDAILVDPLNIPATSAAIEEALEMSRSERRSRMRGLRLTVAKNNVYRWAGRMLLDAARARSDLRPSAGISRLKRGIGEPKHGLGLDGWPAEAKLAQPGEIESRRGTVCKQEPLQR